MKKFSMRLLVLGFFLISIILNVAPVYAEEEVYTTADADTYILDSSPSSNYGYSQFLHVTVSGHETEAYFHFDFTDKPNNWDKAEIKIYPQSFAIPFYVTVYLITEVWDEYTLNWINRPSLGEIIASLTISTSNITFDVSDYITGEGISICLKTTNPSQLGILTIYSKEWASSKPQLIWTYTPEDLIENPTDAIPGYSILIVILCPFVFVFIVYRRQRRPARMNK